MLTRPWMILSAPRVAWYLPDDPAAWPELRHLNTEHVDSLPSPSSRKLLRGHSLWAAKVVLEPGYAPLLHFAWEWVEVRPGVACLVDPNGILTNIDFLGADGCVLPPLMATICATRLVTATPWQQCIAEALSAEREILGDASANPAAIPVPAGFGMLQAA